MIINRIKKKNKRGVSEMVGYVLLITLAIVMGIIAYSWMKTYLPKEINICPDGVSLFIEKAELNQTDFQLKLTLKNNGLFDVYGYFIYAKSSSNQEIATIDLSAYHNPSFGGVKVEKYIKFFSLQTDILSPGERAVHVFNIPSNLSLYSISIIPTRFEKEDNKERFVTCGNSITTQIIGEPEIECDAEELSVKCGSRECGKQINNCGTTVSCGSCGSGESCSTEGQC